MRSLDDFDYIWMYRVVSDQLFSLCWVPYFAMSLQLTSPRTDKAVKPSDHY